MADKKISELPSITGADVDDANDTVAIVDSSTNTTKKITREELFKDVDSILYQTIHSGFGAPSGTLGNDGDFYIDKTNDDFYGPKSGGSWGSPTSLVGPQGPTGPTGPQGPQGPAGPNSEVIDDTSPQLGGFLDSNGHSVWTSHGAAVTAASTLSLGNDGNKFDINGNTTITGIGGKIIGAEVTLHFTGTPTLTHSAALDLPTGANITAAAGDVVTFYQYGVNQWRCKAYTRADGTPLAGGGGGGDLLAANNLSDLNNAGTARTNLGLGDLAEQDSVNLSSQVTGLLAGTSVLSATTTSRGTVEAATTAEGDTGTSTSRFPPVSVVRSMIDTHAPDSPVQAWVSFSGTGTVTVNGSMNVSSVTDDGTGRYTVNFANALSDANYAAVVSSARVDTDASGGGNVGFTRAHSKTASQVEITTTNSTGGLADHAMVEVAVFR